MNKETKKLISWMLYHRTGVFFKYERNEKKNKLQLTHAIMPINYDELFVSIDRIYTELEKYANWPYFKIRRCSSKKISTLSLVKIYFMTDEGIKYIGWYKNSMFNNRNLFLMFNSNFQQNFFMY